jgi:hypothetical protein
VDDLPVLLLRDADVRRQPEGFQPVQQAILIEGHHLRCRASVPGTALPGPGVPAIACVGELPAADGGHQREGATAVFQQAVFECLGHGQRQAPIPDED